MKSKGKNELPSLVIDSEAIRHIRQHARSSSKAEVCGILIGNEENNRVEVEACIAGMNAEEAGAHVTFTQDTWQHIYEVKDRDYPEHRIVGWYHSHPGFGVFLSDHDTFIHKNFFSSPRQVAWVYDPHSDEEGCFGWHDGQIERLPQIRISDRRGGERVQESGKPEPTFDVDSEEIAVKLPPQNKLRDEYEEEGSVTSLQQLTTTILSHLTVLLIGLIIAWYLLPRIEYVGVPVDPMTGQPLDPRFSQQQMDPNAPKENNGQR